MPPEYDPPAPKPVLTSPLQVANVNVGDLSSGDVIAEGTLIEDLLRQMLVKALFPTLSLSGTGAKTVEMGTSLSPTLTANYNARDGGAVTALTIDGQDVTPAPYTLVPTAFQIGALTDIRTQVQYQASADYDNSGATPSGTVTSGTVTYRGRRYIFRGTGNATPTTSAAVRGLSDGGNAILDARNGKSFSISVPNGATSVEFAYPSALGAVSQIQFVGALTSDVTSDYTQTTVTVNGGAGDGSYAIPYYVYRRQPSSAYSASTINVTI